MASANQRKAKFISKKLKFLKNQRDHLINDVGLYVSRIIAAGESWMEGGDNKLEYLELCHMIDAAIEFLWEKCEELAGGTVDVAVSQLSRPSCEQSNLATQVITGTASSSATSNRQTAAPLAFTATASYNQPAVSVQPADETQLKPALARIAVIEEALWSFRGNAEKVAEQQSCIDQQLKELLTKLSESDKKHSAGLRKVKEQISEISDVQDAINEEHKTRCQSLERKLQKVSTAQDAKNEEHKTRCQSLERQLQKVPTSQDAINEEHKTRLQNLERQLQKVPTAQDAVTEEHKTRLQSQERQLQKVSTAQDAVNEEHKTRLQSLERQLQKVSTAQDAINEVHKTRLQSLERQLQKVSTAQDAVNEEHKTRLQSLERQLQKVSTAEEAINEEHKTRLQSLERQLQKVSTAEEAINEEHKTRLQSLERQLQKVSTAQEAINEEHKTRLQSLERQLQKVSTAEDAVNEEHKTRLQSLERQLQKVSTAEEAINEEHKTRLQSQERQLQKVSTAQDAINEEHKTRLQSLERQLQKVSTAQEAINEEHKTRLQSLERQLQKVPTAQDRLDREVELQIKRVKKVVHFPNQLEAVKENVDVLDARIERIIDECRIKHEDINTVTHDLVNKVTANTHTIQVISEGQEQKMTLLRELETRLKTLETNSGRHVKDFQKQAEQGEANEVAVMSPRLQQLKIKASRPGCGFSASKRFSECIDGMTITQYEIRDSTVGNNFDADSGIFTAPFDGLYVVAVSLMLPENKDLIVEVKVKENLSEEPTIFCWCSAAVRDTTACSMSVVHLKVGDKLFMSVNGTLESDRIYVKFTCFLLS